MLVEVVVDVCVVGFRDGECLVEGWMCFDDVFEQLACRGLAAFGHPEARDDGVAVRAPHARDEDRIW